MKFALATILSVYFSTVVGWNPFLAVFVMFGLIMVYNKLVEGEMYGK